MIFPASQDRGVVVFLIWNNLSFQRRLAVSLLLVTVGLLAQAITFNILYGLPFLLVGNLLLLVRGINNRVDFGRYDPSAQWERVSLDKLNQLFELDQRMVRWDRNALDVTNVLGAFSFLLVTGGLTLAAIVSGGAFRILAIDLMVLLLPHWLTGARAVMRKPNLILKARVMKGVLDTAGDLTRRHQVGLLMLLKGEAKVPADLKIKIDIEGHSEGFLGLYGQVVLNRVQGKPYPYFYVVLVAKQGFDLAARTQDYQPPAGVVREVKTQSEVEVVVIRQRTTKKTGFHTKHHTMILLLSEGLRLAEQVAISAQESRTP